MFVYEPVGKVFIANSIKNDQQLTVHIGITINMEDKLSELEQFLNTIVNNYPPLPKATNIEERLDKAAAYGALLTDYKEKASSKIRELFADERLNDYNGDIHTVANKCLRNYHRQQVLAL